MTYLSLVDPNTGAKIPREVFTYNYGDTPGKVDISAIEEYNIFQKIETLLQESDVTTKNYFTTNEGSLREEKDKKDCECNCPSVERRDDDKSKMLCLDENDIFVAKIMIGAVLILITKLSFMAFGRRKSGKRSRNLKPERE